MLPTQTDKLLALNTWHVFLGCSKAQCCEMAALLNADQELQDICEERDSESEQLTASPDRVHQRGTQNLPLHLRA